MNELKTANRGCISHLEVIGLANDSARNDGATICSIGAISSLDQSQSTVPLLAHLVDDFLKRYDRVALPTELHR